MILPTLNLALAVGVLAVVAIRLSDMDLQRRPTSEFVWGLLWLWAHVLIGVGVLGLILPNALGLHRSYGDSTMLLCGLLLYSATRWHHRHEA